MPPPRPCDRPPRTGEDRRPVAGRVPRRCPSTGPLDRRLTSRSRPPAGLTPGVRPPGLLRLRCRLRGRGVLRAPRRRCAAAARVHFGRRRLHFGLLLRRRPRGGLLGRRHVLRILRRRGTATARIDLAFHRAEVGFPLGLGRLGRLRRSRRVLGVLLCRGAGATRVDGALRGALHLLRFQLSGLGGDAGCADTAVEMTPMSRATKKELMFTPSDAPRNNRLRALEKSRCRGMHAIGGKRAAP